MILLSLMQRLDENGTDISECGKTINIKVIIKKHERLGLRFYIALESF